MSINKVSEELPVFKYHPNPIETESVKESDDVCLCCNRKRGFIYQASIYTKLNLSGSVCPWCIADGSAAKKFEAIFSDDYPLRQNGISDEVINEVVERTPGFITWQQEVWLTHCADACEFQGDLDKKEANKLDEEAINKFCFENDLDEEDGKEIIKYYEKGGDPAIYKFVCRHCGEIKLYMDCS